MSWDTAPDALRGEGTRPCSAAYPGWKAPRRRRSGSWRSLQGWAERDDLKEKNDAVYQHMGA